MNKPKRSVAVCALCGNQSSRLVLIHQHCNQPLTVRGEKRRCAGFFFDSRSDGLWRTCATCDGSGVNVKGNPCVHCRGHGEVLIPDAAASYS